MRPVSRRHSRRVLVGGSTFRRTPISRSPLDKNPMPGHLSELQPVNAVNTKGQFFRASFGKNPRFEIQLDKRPLSPGTSREAGGVPCLNPRRGLTLLSPVCRDPAIGVGNQRFPAVPASTGDEALFQCTKPSGVPRGPSHLQFPWLLRATSAIPIARRKTRTIRRRAAHRRLADDLQRSRYVVGDRAAQTLSRSLPGTLSNQARLYVVFRQGEHRRA